MAKNQRKKIGKKAVIATSTVIVGVGMIANGMTFADPYAGKTSVDFIGGNYGFEQGQTDWVAKNNDFELWSKGQSVGGEYKGNEYNNIFSEGHGNKVIELNAFNGPSSVSRTIDVIPGETIKWSFDHRKRNEIPGMTNNNKAKFVIYNAQTNVLIFERNSEAKSENFWNTVSSDLLDTFTIPSGVNKIRVGVESASPKWCTVGNLIDNIRVTSDRYVYNATLDPSLTKSEGTKIRISGTSNAENVTAKVYAAGSTEPVYTKNIAVSSNNKIDTLLSSNLAPGTYTVTLTTVGENSPAVNMTTSPVTVIIKNTLSASTAQYKNYKDDGTDGIKTVISTSASKVKYELFKADSAGNVLGAPIHTAEGTAEFTRDSVEPGKYVVRLTTNDGVTAQNSVEVANYAAATASVSEEKIIVSPSSNNKKIDIKLLDYKNNMVTGTEKTGAEASESIEFANLPAGKYKAVITTADVNSSAKTTATSNEASIGNEFSFTNKNGDGTFSVDSSGRAAIKCRSNASAVAIEIAYPNGSKASLPVSKTADGEFEATASNLKSGGAYTITGNNIENGATVKSDAGSIIIANDVTADIKVNATNRRVTISGTSNAEKVVIAITNAEDAANKPADSIEIAVGSDGKYSRSFNTTSGKYAVSVKTSPNGADPAEVSGEYSIANSITAASANDDKGPLVVEGTASSKNVIITVKSESDPLDVRILNDACASNGKFSATFDAIGGKYSIEVQTAPNGMEAAKRIIEDGIEIDNQIDGLKVNERRTDPKDTVSYLEITGNTNVKTVLVKVVGTSGDNKGVTVYEAQVGADTKKNSFSAKTPWIYSGDYDVLVTTVDNGAEAKSASESKFVANRIILDSFTFSENSYKGTVTGSSNAKTQEISIYKNKSLMPPALTVSTDEKGRFSAETVMLRPATYVAQARTLSGIVDKNGDELEAETVKRSIVVGNQVSIAHEAEVTDNQQVKVTVKAKSNAEAIDIEKNGVNIVNDARTDDQTGEYVIPAAIYEPGVYVLSAIPQVIGSDAGKKAVDQFKVDYTLTLDDIKAATDRKLEISGYSNGKSIKIMGLPASEGEPVVDVGSDGRYVYTTSSPVPFNSYEIVATTNTEANAAPVSKPECKKNVVVRHSVSVEPVTVSGNKATVVVDTDAPIVDVVITKDGSDAKIEKRAMVASGGKCTFTTGELPSGAYTVVARTMSAVEATNVSSDPVSFVQTLGPVDLIPSVQSDNTVKFEGSSDVSRAKIEIKGESGFADSFEGFEVTNGAFGPLVHTDVKYAPGVYTATLTTLPETVLPVLPELPEIPSLPPMPGAPAGEDVPPPPPVPVPGPVQPWIVESKKVEKSFVICYSAGVPNAERSDGKFKFSGSSDASSVSVTVSETKEGGKSYDLGIVPVAGGEWSVAMTEVLAPGAYIVTVKPNAPEGSEALSGESKGKAFVVAALSSEVSVQGKTARVSGNASTPNVKITLTKGSDSYGDPVTVAVNPDTDPGYLQTFDALPAGEYTASIETLSDKADTFTEKLERKFVIKHTVSVNEIAAPAGGASPSISGTADSDFVKVIVKDSSDKEIINVTVPVAEDGTWSLPLEKPFDPGKYSVVAKSSDGADENPSIQGDSGEPKSFTQSKGTDASENPVNPPAPPSNSGSSGDSTVYTATNPSAQPSSTPQPAPAPQPEDVPASPVNKPEVDDTPASPVSKPEEDATPASPTVAPSDLLEPVPGGNVKSESGSGASSNDDGAEAALQPEAAPGATALPKTGGFDGGLLAGLGFLATAAFGRLRRR